MKDRGPSYQEGMWKGAPSEGFKKAKALRLEMTEAEKLLWERLNLVPFRKYKFRRQHPLQLFILDFYSHPLRMAVEVDGEYHCSNERKKLDLQRTEALEFQGLQVIRFKNEEVVQNMEDVLHKLLKEIRAIEEK